MSAQITEETEENPGAAAALCPTSTDCDVMYVEGRSTRFLGVKFMLIDIRYIALELRCFECITD